MHKAFFSVDAVFGEGVGEWAMMRECSLSVDLKKLEKRNKWGRNNDNIHQNNSFYKRKQTQILLNFFKASNTQTVLKSLKGSKNFGIKL